MTKKIPIGPTAIIDPPWAYEQASHHKRLTGYSTGHKYNSLSTADLAALPIGAMNLRYCFLWTTGPFIEDAYKLIRAWGMEPITMLAWVKCAEIQTNGLQAFPIADGEDKHPEFKPTYGVGYWFRGCVEPIILAKAPGAPSIRTPFVGLLSPNAGHSRKPQTLHQIVEEYFPGPYVELFGRRTSPGWTVLGNEAPGDGLDIGASIQNFVDFREQLVYPEKVETV